MRKLLLIALLFVSCEKESVELEQAENEACKCGIVKDNIHTGGGSWSVLVQNNCSANIKYFTATFPQTEGGVYCSSETW
jgi:hypothetical protein